MRQPISERAEYLKKVLAPADKAGTSPDLFARYGIVPEVNDPAVIEAQLDFAVKLWRNDTSNPKFGELIRRLLKEHPDCARVLRDPSAREGARRDLLRARENQDRARFVEFDALIAELRDARGALPESTRQQLTDVGTGFGLSAAEIEARLGAARFVDDIGKTRPCLDEAKYKAICEQLKALRAVMHADDVGPTLLSFIGAPFSASPGQLSGLYGSARDENDKRPYGDDKTLASRVLVDVRRYLVEGDPGLYRNAVVAGAKDSLRQRIKQRKQLLDSLDARAYRSMVADAVRLGLDEKWASIAVNELARAERLAIVDTVPAPPARQTLPVPPAPPMPPPPLTRQGPPVPPSPPVRQGPLPPPVSPVPQPVRSGGDLQSFLKGGLLGLLWHRHQASRTASGQPAAPPSGRALANWRFWVGVFCSVGAVSSLGSSTGSPASPGAAFVAFVLAVVFFVWARRRSSRWLTVAERPAARAE